MSAVAQCEPSIVIAVTIDVECDKKEDWGIRYPIQFRSVTEGIPRLLMPLFRQYSIRPTFLLSPEVIQSDECCRVLEAIPDCELGVHLHGEFISPDDTPAPARTDSPQSQYNPELEFEKLANLTNLFESKFGFRPRSFRAGRFGVGRHTLRFLSEVGYLVDSSVTPFWNHNFGNGHERSYWGAPIQPYFPKWDDPGKRGKSTILEVPVTIVHPRFVRWPNWLLRKIRRPGQWMQKLLRLIPSDEPNKPLWLRPWRSTVKEMIYVADTVVNLAPSRRSVVLNMMYHSVEVIPGASPYPQTKADVQYFLDSQERFFQYLFETYPARSVGLSELYAVFSSGEE